jgi:pyridinium-3,5-bisthiocarboxylic acid mononucleotide nickel chelatase
MQNGKLCTGKVMMAQVDHSTGEIIGYSIQKLIQLGTWNVQLLQSITKKNRPGYVLLIDLPEELVETVAVFLASELGIWGYHILESNHVHFKVFFKEKTICLVAGERTAIIKIKPKYIEHDGQLLNIKIDHDQFLLIQEKVQDLGLSFPLTALRSNIESMIWSESDKEVITIDIDSDLHRRENLQVV